MSKKIGSLKIYGDVGYDIHSKTLSAMLASIIENPSLEKEMAPLIAKLSKNLDDYRKGIAK